MRYGLVDGVDRRVSRIVLGTSGMRSYDGAAAILDAFVERGGTCLDSAHVYGGGACEAVLGQWLRRSGVRDGLVLVGKGAHPPDCRPEHIGPQLTESVDRLGVAHVDLYMLHRDAEDVPVREWVDAMHEEVRRGRVRAFGVSNWTTARIDEANAYAAAAGARGMVAVSNHFSLGSMAEPLYDGCVAVSGADAEWFARRQLALFPWSSQARGFFSDVDPAVLDPNMRRCWDHSENRVRRQRAAEVARWFGVPTINVALAYVLAQPFPTFPLIGPRSVAELDVALGALAIDVSPRQLAWLAAG
jgi:aryl-alcohol dehydrogenase-like predicted oxidoreductase